MGILTRLLFSVLLLVWSNLVFADSYSHITIKIYNNSYGTFEADQPHFYNGHLDSNQPEKGDALMAFSATSPDGKGGNSRVSGFINITLNGSIAFSCYFNRDINASPEHLEVNCDKKISDETYKISVADGGSGDITISYPDTIIPFHFYSLGLGNISIMACSESATSLSDHLYKNPCQENIEGKKIIVQFSNAPNICSFTIGKDMSSNIDCGNGVVARYKKSKSAIIFLCEQKTAGGSSCPWIDVVNNESNLNIF